MWPVVFTLALPAAALKPLAAALAALVALGRAFTFRRRLAAQGERVGWWAALWDDKLGLAALAGAVAAAWAAGLLDADVSLPLHSYGLLIAVGFLAGIALAQREARRQGQDADRVGDLAFWILIAAIVGSRLYFIAVNARDYLGGSVTVRGLQIPRILAFWEGGYVFYGGFIGATLAAAWYMRRHRMPFLAYADTIIPSVALGHVFGRLGCFCAGCCWGSVSHAHVPWLAKFPSASLAYQSFAARPDAAQLLASDRLTTVPVHPTQLYEALGELALFALLVFVVRPAKRFHGQVLATWLVAYAVLRTTIELFRGDAERGVYAGLGVGQWTSAVILACGIGLWVYARKRAHPGAAGTAAAA